MSDDKSLFTSAIYTAFCFVFIGMISAGCTTGSDLDRVDSNSNWLKACRLASDCGDSFNCVCGVCTKECELDRDCSDYGASAACQSASETAMAVGCQKAGVAQMPAVCLSPCEQTADCPVSVNASLTCYSDSCVDKTNVSVWTDFPRNDAGKPADTSTESDGSVDSSLPEAKMDGSTYDGGSVDANAASDSGIADPYPDVVVLPNPCEIPGVCKPIGPWPGDNACTPAPPLASRPVCSADRTCTTGVCHIDGTCIEPGQCDENGIATLAITDGLVKDIAVDDKYVYWADYGKVDNLGNYLGYGKILRIPTKGGLLQTIVDNLYKPTQILVDSTHVYFSESRDSAAPILRTVPKESSAMSEIVLEVADWMGRAFQDTVNIYYSTDGTGTGYGAALYMLPKDRSTKAIKLLGSSYYDFGGAGIVVGVEDIYTVASQSGITTIPKNTKLRIQEVIYDVNVCPGLGSATYAKGYFYCGYRGPGQSVEAFPLGGGNPLTIFTPTAYDPNVSLPDYPRIIYYNDRLYIGWNGQKKVSDETSSPVSEIVAVPSYPTGSPNDTKVLVRPVTDPPGTVGNSVGPIFNLSNSGIFWAEMSTDLTTRHRIMRRIHQSP